MSEIHVRKVRETETGGSPTPLEDPYCLIMNLSHTGFTTRIGQRALFQSINFVEKAQMPIAIDFLSQNLDFKIPLIPSDNEETEEDNKEAI